MTTYTATDPKGMTRVLDTVLNCTHVVFIKPTPAHDPWQFMFACESFDHALISASQALLSQSYAGVFITTATEAKP